MGMYTQVRGWFNVDSISGDPQGKLLLLLEGAKQDFLNDKTLLDDNGNSLGRRFVCNNTTLLGGGNGSSFLFFGTELKNYENSAEHWIKYLLKYFPNAEGRVDFQYEEESFYNGNLSKVWLIRSGRILKELYEKTWCYGYGNMAGYI